MNIMERLKQGICSVNVSVEKDDIPIDEGLFSSGMLDSYGLVELIGYIESEFNIEVLDDEFINDNFKNLIAIKDFVRRKLEESL